MSSHWPPLRPGEVVTPTSEVVSPAELLKIFIEKYAPEELFPGGVVVGGADDTQQQKGCVSLMDAGNGQEEKQTRLLWKRVQVRAVGPTLFTADKMGNYLYELLNNQRWLNIEDSSGVTWFVHGIYMATGPSHHLDSSETFESLSFCNITIGADPVPVP